MLNLDSRTKKLPNIFKGPFIKDVRS